MTFNQLIDKYTDLAKSLTIEAYTKSELSKQEFKKGNISDSSALNDESKIASEKGIIVVGLLADLASLSIEKSTIN